jgi:hypothetical protein
MPQTDVVPHAAPSAANWCTVGYKVMVPDGREGRVTSVSGDICRVIADGEAYVTLIPHYIVEPVYPQDLQRWPWVTDQRASSRMSSAPFQPTIMAGALVLPAMRLGNTEASQTRSP